MFFCLILPRPSIYFMYHQKSIDILIIYCFYVVTYIKKLIKYWIINIIIIMICSNQGIKASGKVDNLLKQGGENMSFFKLVSALMGTVLLCTACTFTPHMDPNGGIHWAVNETTGYHLHMKNILGVPLVCKVWRDKNDVSHFAVKDEANILSEVKYIPNKSCYITYRAEITAPTFKEYCEEYVDLIPKGKSNYKRTYSEIKELSIKSCNST